MSSIDDLLGPVKVITDGARLETTALTTAAEQRHLGRGAVTILLC